MIVDDEVAVVTTGAAAAGDSLRPYEQQVLNHVHRLTAGTLTGVSGADPVSFAGTAALLGAVAAVACLLPARRASALNPLTALRRE